MANLPNYRPKNSYFLPQNNINPFESSYIKNESNINSQYIYDEKGKKINNDAPLKYIKSKYDSGVSSKNYTEFITEYQNSEVTNNSNYRNYIVGNNTPLIFQINDPGFGYVNESYLGSVILDNKRYENIFVSLESKIISVHWLTMTLPYLQTGQSIKFFKHKLKLLNEIVIPSPDNSITNNRKADVSIVINKNYFTASTNIIPRESHLSQRMNLQLLVNKNDNFNTRLVNRNNHRGNNKIRKEINKNSKNTRMKSEDKSIFIKCSHNKYFNPKLRVPKQNHNKSKISLYNHKSMGLSQSELLANQINYVNDYTFQLKIPETISSGQHLEKQIKNNKNIK